MKSREESINAGYNGAVATLAMNDDEARSILETRLARYRKFAYSELLPLLNHPQFLEGMGPLGGIYRIEIQVFWETPPQGNLKVFGIINYPGCGPEGPPAGSFVVSSES